jgi:very-short-patch-repair endonuclease
MADAVAIEPQIGAQLQPRRVDELIAELAAQQHEAVARRQLLALGIGRRAIGHRIAAGRLHVKRPGVYAVGHPRLTLEGCWMAAVLATGPGTRLCFRSAAMLWGIRRTDRTKVEVTRAVAGRGLHGIERHRAQLPADEVTVHRGIPVTTVPRTLLDLAAVLTPRQLARAVNQAEILRLGDTLSLNALLQRHPRRPGTRALRGIVADTRIRRSELEQRFLEFLADHDLPQPETNAVVLGFEVDCLWRYERVIVELDGRTTHTTRAAFEADRARDRILQAAGYRVIRITWRQLHDSPAAVAADVRALLRLARTTGG